MLTQEVIGKSRQNISADGTLTIAASEPDCTPEIIMPKGLNWDEKVKWAIETFEKEWKRIDEKYSHLETT